MSFTASTYWELQTGGSDNNGAGFDTGVAGFPTDGTVNAGTGNTSAPVFSSASYNFVAGDVGHWIFIKSGTNSIPGWYKIASVASNKATLDAAVGHAVLFGGVSGSMTGPSCIPNTAAGLATVGTPTNLTWGIDYSQSGGTPKIAFTDLVLTSTTTFTSAANPVGKNFVGNVIKVNSGTGFTVQRVAVISTSGTTATVDKSMGTNGSTGGNGNLGGSAANLGILTNIMAANNVINVKSGTYAITSASTNTAGGCAAGPAIAGGMIKGYSTVRGDFDSLSTSNGSLPLFQAGNAISTFTLLALSGSSSGMIVANLGFDGASLTSSRGVNMTGSGNAIVNSYAINCTNSGIINANQAVRCRVTGCSTQTALSGVLFAYGCEVYGNTVTGISTVGSANAALMHCLSYDNTGASSDGFTTGNAAYFVNCTAYGNGRNGFRVINGSCTLVNCIAENNVAEGFFGSSGANSLIMLNEATYNNSAASSSAGTGTHVNNMQVGTGTFFTDPVTNKDFSLNKSGGGGAIARASIPFPRGTTTAQLDFGAAPSVTAPAQPVNAGALIG